MATGDNTTGKVFASTRKFGQYPDLLDVPINLLRVLSIETTPENREQEGLFKVFGETPISDTRIGSF